jgi:hypothetical protein
MNLKSIERTVMKRFSTILLVAVFTVAGALAHDKSLHKGKPTEGTISSVAGDRIELKTLKGNVNISLTSKTKIEHGNQVVDRTHLKTGDSISVFGTKLPSGELVAKEILIGAPAAGSNKGKTSKEHGDHGKATAPATPKK